MNATELRRAVGIELCTFANGPKGCFCMEKRKGRICESVEKRAQDIVHMILSNKEVPNV